MRKSNLLLVLLISTFVILPKSLANPVTSEILSTEKLIQELQSGGHIIYMRHSKTDHSQNDTYSKDGLADCSTQRNLSAEGRKQAETIGRIIQQLKIPIGYVISSPYCRCKETAQIACGEFAIEPRLRFSISKTKQESATLGKDLRSMMMAMEPQSANHVLVGHTSNLRDGLGVWPKPEGVIAVFERYKEDVVYKGMIKPDMWPDIE
jgi:phosphohistidine phosphatase SixA